MISTTCRQQHSGNYLEAPGRETEHTEHNRWHSAPRGAETCKLPDEIQDRVSTDRSKSHAFAEAAGPGQARLRRGMGVTACQKPMPAIHVAAVPRTVTGSGGRFLARCFLCTPRYSLSFTVSHSYESSLFFCFHSFLNQVEYA
jgi:hypothetical protein